MKPFKAIAAMSLNRVIGTGNQIPWHLPEDFKWFKATTTGHVIVMGRKTFESIGKPLPNRETIVLSRSAFSHPGVKTMHDLSELLAWMEHPSPRLPATLSPADREKTRPTQGSRVEPLNPPGRGTITRAHPAVLPSSEGPGVGRLTERKSLGQRQVFICGGAQIYEQTLPLCAELFLTLVKREVSGDAFFPPFEDQFELAEEIRDTPEFKILRYQARGK